MLTRRRFLFVLPALAAAEHAFAALPFHKKRLPPPPAPMRVYFGTDTTKGVGKGIYQSQFDSVKGMLSSPVFVAETARPSYLAVSPARGGPRFLYAVNAVPNPSATVTTFAIDPQNGALHQLGQVTSAGAGPAYVSVDATGHSVFVADYVGSSIASYRVHPDGTLSQPVERIDFKDAKKFGALGSNSKRQDVPHPHCVTFSPDNRFLLVCDLGTDHISVFAVDPDSGHLSQTQLFTNNRPGSGPRHVAFHPNGRWVYGINEIDSTINHYLWTATRFSEKPEGMLVNTIHMVKTIAPNVPAGKNTAAELAIAPNGAFLYASNRGEDTLVVFAINPKDGNFTLIQRIACGGKTPRHFTLSPTSQWLLCGNQDSATVTVFRRNTVSGLLTGPTQTVPLDSPLFTLFV
jgi:6-phosphogluconolactonase